MKKRALFLTFMGTVIAAMTAPVISNLPLKVIYNASASAPLGFYYVTQSSPKRGAFVVISLPPGARKLATERRYLPHNIPLLKRIVALSGDEICRVDSIIFINKQPVTTAFKTDNQGRLLSVWRGCFVLKPGQFFALMDHPDSFDGRYFGPLNTRDIIGVAMPVFIWR